MADSRLIAEALGIAHKNLLETLKKHQTKIENKFQRVAFETRTLETNGGVQSTRIALLTEDQAIFVATLSRNTAKVVDFKALVIASFSKARRQIQEAKDLLESMQVNQNHLQEITTLKQEVNVLQQNMKVVMKNFAKASIYLNEMQDEIDELHKKSCQNTDTVENTVERVDKIEEKLDFKAVACIYVLFCPRRRWYKIGSSHNAKGRKKAFDVIDANLVIILEIPVFSRDEAYNQETTLKKRFITKHQQGEWYALDENDLAYLKSLEQSNIKHLMQQMA